MSLLDVITLLAIIFCILLYSIFRGVDNQGWLLSKKQTKNGILPDLFFFGPQSVFFFPNTERNPKCLVLSFAGTR